MFFGRKLKKSGVFLMEKNIIRKKERREWFYSYNMIFEAPVSEHAKIIYLYLCRCADGEGQSFPSYNTMGKKCGIRSRQTVANAIKELESFGLLVREQRKKENGGQTSNLYTIYDTPVQQMDTPCPANGHPPVQQMDTPCPAGEHEVLPKEVLPTLNNNNYDKKITKANQVPATTTENKKNVVDVNNLDTKTLKNVYDFQRNEVLQELKNNIEEITNNPVVEGELRKFLTTVNDGEQRIRRAIKNYPAVSQSVLKTKDITNPVGLLLYIAKNKIDPPQTKVATSRLNKRLDFDFYPQHEYTEEELESLIEPIS
jgi:hypothetical protein